MAQSPHKLENLALARDTLTNLELIRQWAPEQRRQMIELAQAILQTDRACRLGLDDAVPQGPARIIRIPLAVFQAGRTRNRPRRAVKAHPTTPGDAA